MSKWKTANHKIVVKVNKVEEIIVVLVAESIIDDWPTRSELVRKIQIKFRKRALLLSEQHSRMYAESNDLLDQKWLNKFRLKWQDAELDYEPLKIWK